MTNSRQVPIRPVEVKSSLSCIQLTSCCGGNPAFDSRLLAHDVIFAAADHRQPRLLSNVLGSVSD